MNAYYFENDFPSMPQHRSIVTTVLLSIMFHAAVFYQFQDYEASKWDENIKEATNTTPVKMTIAAVKPKPQPPKKEVLPKPVKKKPPIKKEVVKPEEIVEPEPEIEEEIIEELDIPEEVVEEEPEVEQQEVLAQVEQSDAQTEATTNDYISLIQQLIESKKVYPRAARRRRIEGEVDVSFILNLDGTVAQVRSQGDKKVLNSAAVNAVKAVSPLPAPPEMIAKPLELSFTMVFKLI